MVWGTMSWRKAITEAMSSSAPAAPSAWPIMDFVDDKTTRRAWFPNLMCTAAVSAWSLATVPVPWALT